MLDLVLLLDILDTPFKLFALLRPRALVANRPGIHGLVLLLGTATGIRILHVQFVLLRFRRYFLGTQGDSCVGVTQFHGSELHDPAGDKKAVGSLYREN